VCVRGRARRMMNGCSGIRLRGHSTSRGRVQPPGAPQAPPVARSPPPSEPAHGASPGGESGSRVRARERRSRRTSGCERQKSGALARLDGPRPDDRPPPRHARRARRRRRFGRQVSAWRCVVHSPDQRDDLLFKAVCWACCDRHRACRPGPTRRAAGGAPCTPSTPRVAWARRPCGRQVCEPSLIIAQGAAHGERTFHGRVCVPPRRCPPAGHRRRAPGRCS
jgi:hypothetical protein